MGVRNNFTFLDERRAFMPQFKTIRQAAATGLIPEYRLRILVAEGRCPGIYAGNRFLVNVEALAEKLDRESRANLKEDENND